jgi:hypothetical protein
MNMVTIIEIAEDNGWYIAERQPDASFIRFTKGVSIIDVWMSTGTLRFIAAPYSRAQHYRDNTAEDFNRLFETL